MALLCLDSLSKTYPDGTIAVRDISIEINTGEFIVLLGPSGCGKTTALRMLAGLETPTGGRIFLDGQDITSRPPAQRDVGFVFQFYALYPHMTVADNISFPLENMGMPVSERKSHVAEVSSRMGISDLMQRHPGQLSGGDQQRVSLARAMVRKPMMYLMDEPLGTLDADRRLSMREFIRQQQLETGVTTIYVTHDQEEAMALADRIVVMRDGQISQFDTPMRVYEEPSDTYTARFVGSPGMNIFQAELKSNSGLPKVDISGLTLELDEGAVTGVAAGQVRCGIRAEYLTIGPVGRIPANIVLVEHLGSYANIYADTPLGRLVSRAPADASFESGESVWIDYRKDAVRVWPFDDSQELTVIGIP